MSSYKFILMMDKATPGTVRYRELIDEGKDPAMGTLYLKKPFVQAAGGDIIGWEVALTPIRNDRSQNPEEKS